MSSINLDFDPDKKYSITMKGGFISHVRMKRGSLSKKRKDNVSKEPKQKESESKHIGQVVRELEYEQKPERVGDSMVTRKSVVCNMLKIMLDKSFLARGAENKAAITSVIFACVSEEDWLLKENENFASTNLRKCKELMKANSKLCRHFIEPFARKYFPDDKELMDMFEEEDQDKEKQDPENYPGDSLPEPKVTKEELDRELSQIVEDRESALEKMGNSFS